MFQKNSALLKRLKSILTPTLKTTLEENIKRVAKIVDGEDVNVQLLKLAKIRD